MPELPEVETVLRDLEKILTGRVVKQVTVRQPRLRDPIPPHFAKTLKGRSFTGFQRRAKYMVLDLSGQKSLLVHLGMSGSFIVQPTDENAVISPPEKHDHVVFTLDDGHVVYYRDPRRFGMMDVADTKTIYHHQRLTDLGVEPLERTFTGGWLYQALRNRNIPIKQAIMDQHLVVGVGNIYASEALYAAGINPLRPSNTVTEGECHLLVKQIKKILRAAIAAEGSTLRDYHKVNGNSGKFQNSFAVYDREGEACPHCDCRVAKTGGIRRVVQGGRSTFYCATRQK